MPSKYEATRDPVKRAASRAARSERRRQLRAENPEQRHAERVQSWKQQGINPWAAMWALAGHKGRCDICGATEPKGMGDWHVDHRGSIVRGILCAGCNMLLGRVEAVGLGRIVSYLTANHERQTA